MTFDICQPSPKKRSEAPSFSFFLPSSPAKQAEPGLVEHALADAVAQLALELLGLHGEEQHGNAGAAVGRLLGLQLALDPGLGAAGNHRSGKARHGARGDERPFQGGRGDDDPRADHGKGLGEGLDDGDAFQLQVWHGTVAKRWGRPAMSPGTPKLAGPMP